MKKRLIIITTIIILIVLLSTIFMTKTDTTTIAAKVKSSNNYNTINTATELVKDMKIGWNLGNTLDSPDGKNKDIETSYYETLWENPITTKEMITEVKNAGFNSIRIPVTWFDHVYIEENGVKSKNIKIDEMNVTEISKIKIEENWMNRVKEVIDYAIQNDMYCILNVHHDVGTGTWPWIFASSNENNRKKYETVLSMLWTQIANEFKSYDNRLLYLMDSSVCICLHCF